MQIAVILACLNSAVLVFLLVLYGRIASKTKSMYSLGLVIFALFLLAQNMATVLSYLMMAPFFEPEALPFLSTFSGLEFIGLVVLAKITF